MPAAPIPENEVDRLEALRSYDLLDTPPEEAFDRLTALASRLFKVPIAIISLMDAERLWSKSQVGLEATEMDRSISFCSHTILSDHPLIVPDTRLDHRFADNPLVTGEPHVRFYAGAALRSMCGHVIGTLDILDKLPRILTPEESTNLEDLAAIISREMELRRVAQKAASDSEERRQIEEQIKQLAYYDTLTGLPNRRMFKDRLELTLAQTHRSRQQVGVLFLDLDRFKVVNDSLGHRLGDQLLQRTADRLRHSIRGGDTLARLGGDEFTVLLHTLASAEDIVIVAERIIEAIRPAFFLDGREVFVTTSIGGSVFPEDGIDADGLLKNAEVAMYRAKNQGRNSYQLFTPVMNQRALERLGLETSLHKALANQEFILHYQPQTDLRTGQIIGMEALVRWHMPDRGLVPPGEFIPLAEETGLIVPLGQWVLRAACEQTQLWHSQGFAHLRVAVNLSLRQFLQPDLVPTIDQILRETGLDPSCLELEITESVAMEGIDSKIATLNHLKALGAHVSLDDFGTGYSSLNYLKQLPIDNIKIDRSFVSMITLDPRDAAIATTIITMAHQLGLTVIAEGVELPEQLEFLRKQDCDVMQGYLFSEPVCADEFTVLLKEGRCLYGSGMKRAA